MGRPVSGYFESFGASELFNHYSEAGFAALGTSSLNTPDHMNFTLRQPYGVVAAIIPWNVPILFLANKAAPALIAGNTVVVKSSEKAPLTVSNRPTATKPCICVVTIYRTNFCCSLPKLRP